MHIHPLRKLIAVTVTCASALVTLATTSQASEPAFDCKKADGQVQELICSNDQLATLDQRLTEVYVGAMKHLPPEDLPQLKTEQRGWIKGRDDCWKSNDVTTCVTSEYQTRIVQLQIISGELTAPAAAGYDCGKNEKAPFFAAFYADTTPPAAVLTRGNDQVIAFIDRSGSGARYTAEGVEFWEHQGEAKLNWFGIEKKCTVMK